MSPKRREEITFRLTQALHEFEAGRASNALTQLHEAERHLENGLVEDEITEAEAEATHAN